jgi:predicted O-methyltransferase YrrM
MLFDSPNRQRARLRKKALDLTPHGLPAQFLRRFEELVFHAGMSGNPDVHYQDAEIRGAVCCTPSEAMLLNQVAQASNARRALEIGSYIGWSTAHIAAGLQCTLTCVDPFLETGAGGETTAERAHARFLQNIQRAGLSDKVQLVRARSPDALPEVSGSEQWDFIFVDGWHLHGQPVKDVAGVLPFAAPNAVLLLHDLWIADVRDAFIFLITHGWSHRIFATSNYLTLLWRGAEPPWLGPLVATAESEPYALPSARGRRLFLGLSDDALAAVQHAHAVAARE